MNHTQVLEGNLTRDPEERVTHRGKPAAYFRIAVHESRPDDDSEQTHFWNIRAYGDLAANVIASFHQGDRVVVLGKVRSYPKDVFDDKGDSYQVALWNVDATDVAASVLWAQIPKIVRTGARHAATANQPGNGAGSRAGAGAVYHDEEPF